MLSFPVLLQSMIDIFRKKHQTMKKKVRHFNSHRSFFFNRSFYEQQQNEIVQDLLIQHHLWDDFVDYCEDQNEKPSFYQLWHWIFDHGSEDLILKLIERLDIHVTDSVGCNPLHYALKKATPPCLKALIEAGVDVHQTCTTGYSPLMLLVASMKDDNPEARRLAFSNLEIFLSYPHRSDVLRFYNIDSWTFPGWTVLNFAIENSWPEAARLFIQKGFPLDHSNKPHYSYLNHALLKKEDSIARYLIESGANVHHIFKDSSLKLEFSSLMCAAKQGNLSMVQFLIQNGAQLNFINTKGENALMYATQKGRIETAQFLLNLGADPLLKDEHHFDSLMHSIAHVKSISPDEWTHQSSSHLEWMQTLIDQGCSLNHWNIYHRNPLMEAVVSGHLEVVKLLVSNGALMNCLPPEDSLGYQKTALMWAASLGHTSIVDYLLSQGADPHVMDRQGHTALLLAIQQAKIPVIHRLLQEKCGDPRSPLQRPFFIEAVLSQSLETVQVLIDAQFDVDIKDQQGWSALDYAKKQPNLLIYDYLKNFYQQQLLNEITESTMLPDPSVPIPKKTTRL